MKSNELMLGNFVITEDNVFAEVCEIYTSNLLLLNYPYLDPITFSQPTELIKPIPITSDWLVKLGFEDDDKIEEGFIIGYFIKYIDLEERSNEFALIQGEDGYYLAEDHGTELVSFTSGKALKYVHEIQNAFHLLTGQELTIKL